MKNSRLIQVLTCAIVVLAAGYITYSCENDRVNTSDEQKAYPDEFTLSKTSLLDKIKGGWAGQVIGCTYGGPTEFQVQRNHDSGLYTPFDGMKPGWSGTIPCPGTL